MTFTPEEENPDVYIVADIKGLESEMKPLLPKLRKRTRTVLTAETIKLPKKKYKEAIAVKKEIQKQLPKLHIDYDQETLTFNGNEFELSPEPEKIQKDIDIICNFMDGLSNFKGDWRQAQNYYFAFMNWYFASPFMPYLRYMAEKNDYSTVTFPVVGILRGDSNGGKSTFIKLLCKLMCGIKIPFNNSNDFTVTNIEKLKRASDCSHI